MMSEDLTKLLHFRRNLIRISVTFIVTFAFVWKGNADPLKTPHKINETNKPAKTTSNDKSTPSSEENESVGKTTSGGTRRDPFLIPSRVVRAPKVVKPAPPPKPEPKPLPFPALETRLNDYKKQVRDFYEGRAVEPGKLTPYLIEELTVTGTFRNDEGYGVFVAENVTQNRQMFFARVGWRTFDGYIKEILPTGVKFIRSVRLDNGTVRQVEEFRALPTAK
ncbi:MAG TPA: hypothetical protein VFZ34_32485 [Blastocatellia bacterium]|nr:hypothetical protein [Blastocatellia bacterium]